MGGPTLLLLVTATSLGAVLLGNRGLGRRAAGLPRAGRRVLECVGLTVLFLGANLAVGVAAVLALRLASGRFVSLYALDDPILLAFSALQALAWAWWRERE